MNCPICRADNATGPLCRRCKADLTLLFDLDEQRSALLAQVRQLAAEGNWSAVADRAQQALQMRFDQDACQLAAIAALLQGDYPMALACYRMYTSAKE